MSVMTHLRDERGSALTIGTVLLATVFTLILGIAVDLSGQIQTKRQAFDVAAQAARVAGQQIDAETYMATGRTVKVDPARARAAASTYVRASGMTDGTRIESTTRLVVTATASYRPQFLSMLGVGNLRVTGEASINIIRTLDGRERR